MNTIDGYFGPYFGDGIEQSPSEFRRRTCNELSLIAKCIYMLATSDEEYTSMVGMRFYEGVSPKGATFPAGMFVRVSGRDINGAFGARLAVRSTYQIKGVCEGDSYAPLEGLADVLDGIFQGLSQYTYMDQDFRGNAQSLTIIGIRRIDVVQYSETDSGVRRNHMGGVYEIFARDSSSEY